MSFFKTPFADGYNTRQCPIDRSVLDVGGQPLVLFHKRGQSLENERTSNLVGLMRSLELGPVVDLTDNDWSWCQAQPENFNCHALSIGSTVGLTPHDWLEGKASPATFGINPVQLLLDHYFEPIHDRIVDNDIFVLRQSSEHHLVHSGFVRWINGSLIAVSKFGERQVFMTTLELVSTIFRDDFDTIDWYRSR